MYAAARSARQRAVYTPWLTWRKSGRRILSSCQIRKIKNHFTRFSLSSTNNLSRILYYSTREQLRNLSIKRNQKRELTRESPLWRLIFPFSTPVQIRGWWIRERERERDLWKRARVPYFRLSETKPSRFRQRVRRSIPQLRFTMDGKRETFPIAFPPRYVCICPRTGCRAENPGINYRETYVLASARYNPVQLKARTETSSPSVLPGKKEDPSFQKEKKRNLLLFPPLWNKSSRIIILYSQVITIDLFPY